MNKTGIDYGKPPKGGLAPIVCELYVNEIAASLHFWCDILGFEIAYQRPEERFAYLHSQSGAQLMLYQPNESITLEKLAEPEPKAMLQIFVDNLLPIETSLKKHDWPVLRGPETVWRRYGDRMRGNREIRLSDPDGHRVLVAEGIGERPLCQN